MTDAAVHGISARLSLRAPQHESLEILARVTELVSLQKNSDPLEALTSISAEFPSVEDFERDNRCGQEAANGGVHCLPLHGKEHQAFFRPRAQPDDLRQVDPRLHTGNVHTYFKASLTLPPSRLRSSPETLLSAHGNLGRLRLEFRGRSGISGGRGNERPIHRKDRAPRIYPSPSYVGVKLGFQTWPQLTAERFE